MDAWQRQINTSLWASPELAGSVNPGTAYRNSYPTSGLERLCLERSMLTWCLTCLFTGDNWKQIVVIIAIKPKIHVNLINHKIACGHREKEIFPDWEMTVAVTCHLQNRELTGQPDGSTLETSSTSIQIQKDQYTQQPTVHADMPSSGFAFNSFSSHDFHKHN